MLLDDFERDFHLLTGHIPFPWQESLYREFCQMNIPRECDLPTGLGKTSVIAIWLLALAHHVSRNTASGFPRRLVYVVNRRTVVDQTTDEVEKLRNNLLNSSELIGMKRHLGSLAVSTLRGQFADNQEWYADPSRPAVICGTVDMIGSRLLFSGYRIGFKSRPLHAGFLGQDALLVHDEAHLEPAFQQLVESINKEQRTGEQTGVLPWPKLSVMALSATTRTDHDSAGKLGLTAADREINVVNKRINAAKKLTLVEIEDEKGNKLSDKLIKEGFRYANSDCAVLVFARKVEDVEKIARKLPKESTLQLTGTLRGLERDHLVQEPVFQHFLPKASRLEDDHPSKGTVYLVCTSAGEVGVNISADHLVCDLSTFDSMAQRFGRVNRFGDCDDTEVTVVHPKSFDTKKQMEKRRQRTMDLLKELDGDACPAALEVLNGQQRLNAFSPEPTILAATDILFDAWAMTSVRERMPGRPLVAPYLHGVAEWEPPQTTVAWREDVEIIQGDLLDRYNPEDLLEAYPLKPHELLQDRSDRVFKKLGQIAKRHPDTPVWFLDESGSVEVLQLTQLTDTKQKGSIYGQTILLPPFVGGLKAGLLDAGSNTAADVSDRWMDENGSPRRIRLWDDEPPPVNMSKVFSIDVHPDAEEFDWVESGEENENNRAKRRFWCWYVKPRQAPEPTRDFEPPVLLAQHTRSVVNRMIEIVDRLALPNDLRQTLLLAAALHDQGKKREIWQRSIGNPNPDDWYAKPGKPKTGSRWLPRFLSGYRHEFGSVLDMLDPDQVHGEFDQLNTEMQDLVLHLVAAHHGRARPHFPAAELYDPTPGLDALARTQALEIPRRFARLQRTWGRWGLAYLESLLRAADWAASAEPSTVQETER